MPKPNNLRRAGAPLLVLALGCSSCISTQGQSSGEMKEEILNSCLAKSMSRFYPEGIPSSEVSIYPRLPDQTLRTMAEELNETADALCKLHEERYEVIASAFAAGEPPTAVLKKGYCVKVQVVPDGSLGANTSPKGIATVDVHVLQALFRGSLLGSYYEKDQESRMDSVSHLIYPYGEPPRTFGHEYDAAKQTEDQLESIRRVLKLLDDVRKAPAGPMFEDLFAGGGSRWLSMADFKEFSNHVSVRYGGAVAFLLAHEQGHLALNHYLILFQLSDHVLPAERSRDSDYCRTRALMERQADFYAIELLSQQLVVPWLLKFDDFRQSLGYRNYLAYGYPLAGFEPQPGEVCQYPTNEERFLRLDEILSQAIDNMREEALRPPK